MAWRLLLLALVDFRGGPGPSASIGTPSAFALAGMGVEESIRFENRGVAACIRETNAWIPSSPWT